jgi:NAD(P)-dependent dehydrogenase (short-subunit alcohol dehydrogenase family)
MKLLLKLIVLQIFWFVVVTKSKFYSGSLFIFASFLLVLLDYFLYRPNKNFSNYLTFTFILLIFGLFNDLFSYLFSLLDFSQYSVAQLSLWVVFVAYYENFKDRFLKISFPILFLISGLLGAFTYFSAYRLGGVSLVESRKLYYFLFQFMFWGGFFPLSIKIYRVDSMKDFLLDLSVVFSFDKTGFIRHQKKFNEIFKYPNALNKNALVTGGSDGIGAMVTEKLSEYGAFVTFTGRNQEKGINFQNKLSNSKFVSLDMTNWKQVDEFSKSLGELDFVVLNAGGMPDTISFNEQGVEHQCASQLVGHYLLLERLRSQNKLRENARVVFVSSGGMYLKTLDINSLFNNINYDKVATYANVKRAQVTLVEELARKDEWKNFTLMSMHPGWVETRAVKDALPGFYNLLGKRLRTPYEGADTILWCMLTQEKLETGSFYFDRKKVSPYINNYFCPNQLQRAELIKKLAEFI